MSLLHGFFKLNQRFCDWIYTRLPYAHPHIFHVYEQTVGDHMNAKTGQVVADIGSGKQCPFAKYRQPESHTRIIGVDISDEELKFNQDVDEIRVSDVTKVLPFSDAEVDLLVSKSAIEHFTTLEPFMAESHRVLKKGGTVIHLFPSRNAPYALINRMLPYWLTRRMLHFFWRESEGFCGFRTYYDHCSYRSIQKLLRKHDFEIETIRVYYYQSSYYRFFIPFYLLSVLYELLLVALGLKNLCSLVLVIAKKK